MRNLLLPVTPFLFAATVGAQTLPSLRLVKEFTIEGKRANFTTGVTVRVSPAGTVALVEGQQPRIVIVDRAGTSLRTLGERGEAEGEFLDAAWYGWLGDSLWVADRRKKEITVFGPDRRIARRVPIPLVLQGPPGSVGVTPPMGTHIVNAMFPGGDMLLLSPLLPTGMERKGTGLSLIRTRSDGGFVSYPGTQQGTETDCKYTSQLRNTAIISVDVFCAVLSALPSPDGSILVGGRAESLGDGNWRYQISRVGSKGDSLLPISHTIRTELSDTAALMAEFRKGLPSLMSHPQMVPEDSVILLRNRAARIPKYLPPFSRIPFIGVDSSIWLPLAANGPTTRYLILDAQGGERGIVTLPANFKLRVVRLNEMWGVEEGEGGSGNVVRYRVEKETVKS